MTARDAGAVEERVVLVDEAGAARGFHAKATVHHEATPLHLAFSCYVFDAEDRLLLTQRALSKVTWPGVWTNSVCGHPAPGEGLAAAVRRRAADELGLSLLGLTLVLPRFRYRAVMGNGIVENELCPVFVARTTDPPRVDRAEVESWSWLAWDGFRADVLRGAREVSPWCAEQVVELAACETEAGWFRAAEWADLPEAAR